MPPSPEQIDRERIGTVKRSYERKTLQDAIVQANTRVETLMAHSEDPAFELANKDLEIARKRLELFDTERDPSGAWKGNRFGGDVAKMFDHDFKQEEHGFLVPTEELKQTHLLTVSMSELDRLNKEGGHSLGDEGMGMTYRLLAERVEAKLHDLHPEMKQSELAANYDIYRTSGNEFSIVMRKVPSAVAMQELVSSLVRVDAVSEKYQGVEAPPLAANHAAMAEVYEVLNTLRREEGLVNFKNWEDGQKTRLAVSVVKDVLLTENDIRKTQLRLDRFEGLLKDAATSGDDSKARGFYDNYLKKALGSVLSGDEAAMSSFDEAKSTLKQMGAFDESWAPQWEKEKAQIAMDEGFKNLRSEKEGERTGELNLQKAVALRARRRFEEVVPKPLAQSAESAAFLPPMATDGLRVLEQKRQEAEAAEELAKQNPTVLNQKNAELVGLDYRIESARRDMMTGLEQRGVLFADMEDALKRNESVSTLFIDMAFLKYFDKVGGASVGDMAIKKSAEMLDAVTKDPEWKERFPNAKLKAYRYAGDEFVVTVEGGDEGVAEALRDAITMKSEEAGPVPKAVSSSDSYTPEGVVFNIGISHTPNATELEQRVVDLGLPLHGEPNSKDRINHLAEYAIRFADKEIDIEKAMDRYKRLVKLIDRRGEEDPHVKQMLTYSQKAISGKAGEEKVFAWAKKLKESPEDQERIDREMTLELLEFTLQKKEEELKEKNEQDQAVERRIENHIREQYFERQIKGLNEVISSLEAELQAAEGENAELRQTLTQQKTVFEEERTKISSLRDKVLSS